MSFYDKLSPANVAPLWRARGLLPKEPSTPAVPFLWPYAEVRELLLEAGGVVTAEEAERRVLMLMNPGLDGRPAATANLYAGLQLVLPGEIAPMHRHSAAALRLICEGSGAYTAVDGEKATMEVGDLVLTPSWTWHDHGNETDEPMIWLDGLDLPLLHKLETHFFEVTGDARQALTVPENLSARLYASARMNPSWVDASTPYSPVIAFPWKQVERQLAEAATVSDGTPADGLLFEYVNPFTGGPVMPTLSCHMQLLKPGLHTDAHRHTSAAVYHVVRGNGHSIVGGERLEWTARDTFALPAWAVHEHVNASGDEDAVLFSFSDEPVVRSLGLHREQAVERQG
ncbi:MAG TPA: cupin domain-containing protein [Conexibacter sp.]|jgi:gentisate 1,2-dioxygenase|nr:cupin domain-containing protein [Conexibacter sp.]